VKPIRPGSKSFAGKLPPLRKSIFGIAVRFGIAARWTSLAIEFKPGDPIAADPDTEGVDLLTEL